MVIKTLNEQQRAAIEYDVGPLLIIAGAGTGKTTVVTERIKHLILTKGIPTHQILALTFTEKAAREMEERVDVMMPYGYTQMWILTFHAFCDRVLRSEAINIGLNPLYKLATEAESVLFLRQNIFKLNLSYFRPLGNPNKFLEGLLTHFSRLKDEDVSPSSYKAYVKGLEKDKTIDPAELEKSKELSFAYEAYENLKVKESILDFSDLISHTLLLFRTRPNVLKQYQDQFSHILVDEFQDTNYAQNELAVLLSGKKKNITVVGDDDQAIFRWRGAAVSNMISFRKRFPDTKIVTLTKNYRSTREILDSSYTLIQCNNPDRLEVKEHINKKLESMRKTKGNAIEFLFANRVEDEAQLVTKTILSLTKKDTMYKNIAILVRANDHAGPFIRSLERHRVPYQFLGPGQLFHQEEIKDLIAYLKVLYDLSDSQSLYRVLNMSLFQCSALEIANLLTFARRNNVTLFEALELSQKEMQESETAKRYRFVYDTIQRHLKRVAKETAGQILYYFLSDTNLLEKLLSSSTQKEEKVSQNIARFFEKLRTYEVEHASASVYDVVDWIDLSMQMGESPLATDSDWSDNNAVNILTVHSSKGLEFKTVFITNLVSLRFPTRERSEQIPIPKALIKEILPEGDFHLQEERRLFYVAMTRAKDSLFLTASHFYGEGKRERKVSQFLYESLGKEKVESVIKKEKAQGVAIQTSLLDLLPQKEEVNDKPRSLKISYISYSQIQCFAICPLHYKLKYLLKIPAMITAAQSFGMSVHAALRDFFQMVLKGENVKHGDILTLLKNNWIHEGYTSKLHEQSAYKKAETILKAYVDQNYNPQQPLRIEATELPFQFYLQGVKVGGRIDRVDKTGEGKIEIIDYKTGTNVPEQKDLEKDLQMTMYGLAASEVKAPMFQKNPKDVTLSLYYLEEGKKISTTRTREQLESAKKEIIEKVHQIETSDFLCSRHSFCRNCEYKMICNY